MESFSSELKKPGVKNWFKLCLSLSIVTEGLKDYTTTIVTYLHQQIYQACATTPNCKDNCFKTIECKDKWCSTCISWKNEIMKYCRYKGFAYKIRWDLYDSNSLSHYPEELVKIFIPDWNATYKHYSLDISLLMSLFINCKAFDIHTGDITAVRKVRNEYVAHNQSMTVTDVQFEKCIKRLGTFLHSKAIKETNTGSLALQKLHKVQSLDIINEISKKGENFQFPMETCIKVNEDMFKSLFDSQSQFQEEMRALITNLDVNRKEIVDRRYIGTPRFMFISLAVLAVLGVLIFGYCIGFLWTNPLGKKIIWNYKCEDMAFNYPWPSEIKFDGYIRDHDGFVGRDWLVKDLSNKMESSDKGIYLTAVMGYGKSALFSKILCSSQNSPGWNIRTKLLSFHICKFDVITTQKPDLFIRNIAGKIANYIPEYGNIILDDTTVMRYLRGEKCSEDPFGCLDIAVIDPLNRLINVPDKFVIAIDALDECVSMIENKSPSIPDVLSSRISRFPPWIRFLFTSRNISQIQDNFRLLYQVHMDPFDDRNLRDLQQFINAFITNFKNLDQLSANAAKKLQRVSKGNFLYLKHALIAWSKSDNPSFDNLPITLEDIYKRNFERVFGKNEERFKDARIVFEILCASIEPLSSTEIIAIAKLKSPSIERSIIKLLRNDMGHFLSLHDEYIQIAHKTIKEWLTKSERKYSLYYISNENGNKLFAEYMFRQVRKNITENKLFELAAHVADSKDSTLENRFFHYVQTIFDENKNKSPNDLLHKAAASLNHYKGFKIFFKTLNTDIDSKNHEGVTALFIAASHGHYKTVKSLLDLGANSTFRIEKPMPHFYASDAIFYGKMVTLWGYNSLHIAAQNNHFETTRLLLEMNGELMYKNNSFGLNAFQLAAERGNTRIMQLFLNKSKSFADDHSLYYASQNGHYKAVKLILRYHFSDECPKCNGSLYWLRGDAIRMQSHVHGYQYIHKYNSSHFYIKEQQNQMDFLDDWRLLSCDTALHAAITNCHLKVVKALLKSSTKLLKCTNFHGYTPLHFSIVYNCPAIFNFIVDQGSDLSQNCKSNINILESQLNKLNGNELQFVRERPCSKSPTLAHLLAKFNRFESALTLYNKLDWSLRDNDNCSALHYAACFSSTEMIVFLIKKGIGVDIKSANGSTPFHSAVACNSEIALLYLKEGSKSEPDLIRTLIDNENRDILTYLFLPKLEDQPVDENIEGVRIRILSTILNDLYGGFYDFNTFDRHGQTTLNYAILNGHFRCINWLYYNKLTHVLFDWKDPNNKTVLDLAFDAFKNLPASQNAINYRVETNIAMYTLSPYDLTAILFLTKCGQDLRNFQSKIGRYEYIAAENGRYYVLMTLRTLSSNNTIPLVSILLHSRGSILLEPLALEGKLHVSVFNCSKETKEFPLHRIVMNKSNKYWYYSPYHSMLLNITLHEYSPETLDSCTDNAGYNLLQRASLGGHIAAIKFLIGKGMDIHKRSSSNLNLLELTIANAPFENDAASILINAQLSGTPGSYTIDYFNSSKLERREIVINNSSETINFDQSAAFLFKTLSVTCQEICRKSTKELSLVHIAAAKGLIQFFKTAKESCGLNILNCETIDRITPFYLAKLYVQRETIQYLRNKSAITLPNKEAESVIIMKLLFSFNNPIPANSTIWKCLSIKNIFPIWRTLFKKKHCIFTARVKAGLVEDDPKPNFNYSTFRGFNFKLDGETRTTFFECLLIPHFFNMFHRSALPLFEWTDIDLYKNIHVHLFNILRQLTRKNICESKWKSCEILVSGHVKLADKFVNTLYEGLRNLTKQTIALKYVLFRKSVVREYIRCKATKDAIQSTTTPNVSFDISFGCIRLMELAPWIMENSQDSFDRYMRTDNFDVLKGYGVWTLFIGFSNQ